MRDHCFLKGTAMSKEDQKEVYDLMNTPVIAYAAGLSFVLGGIEPAIIISQLLYWQGMGRDQDWVYKTVADLEAETGVSRHRQFSAIQKCKQLGVLEVEYKGVPRKRHYWVHIEKLKSLITSNPNIRRLEEQKPSKLRAEKRLAITDNTKDYSDTTQKITSKLVRTDFPTRHLNIIDTDSLLFNDLFGGNDGNS